MKKVNIVLLLAFLLLHANGVMSQQSANMADSLRNWLSFLASDEMKGRGNQSEEIGQVAEWLSAKYQQYGLKAVGDLKDFVQPYILSNDSSFIHKNIIGYLPAKEESDKIIVLSAHFDHIGMRNIAIEGDSIFNGADDNASGVVAMLAIAKNLYEQNLTPDCSVVFAAFSNEERGLIGSKYFCDSDVIPVQNIKINLNLEMLGRTDEYGKNKYYVTGPGHSNFQDIILQFNEDKNWEIAEAGTVVDMLFRMSDNYSFVAYANKNNFCIPAHTIATSVGMGRHIHHPKDEVEFIDFENLTNVVNNLTQLVLYLADKNVDIKCN